MENVGFRDSPRRGGWGSREEESAFERENAWSVDSVGNLVYFSAEIRAVKNGTYFGGALTMLALCRALCMEMRWTGMRNTSGRSSVFVPSRDGVSFLTRGVPRDSYRSD